MNTVRLGIAAALVAAVSYTLCAMSVALWPGATSTTFSYVMHIDLTQLTRVVTWGSFCIGLLAFSAVIGLLVWGTAAVYQWLMRDRVPR